MDFIATVSQCMESGFDEKQTRIAVCDALIEELNALKGQGLEPYLFSVRMHREKQITSVTLNFPRKTESLSQ